MIFKFKTRIGTLLREMNISVLELGRFTSLGRIDEILDFLSEKVRESLTAKTIESNKNARVRNTEHDKLIEY